MTENTPLKEPGSAGQWTPGAVEPGERWIMAAGPSSIVGWPIVSSPDGQSICNLSWIGKKPDHITDEGFAAYRAKVEARGRLIAAAPALLEALQYGFALYGYDGPDGPWPTDKRDEFDRLARAAIALATHPEGER